MSRTQRAARRAIGFARSRRRVAPAEPAGDSALDSLESRLVWIFGSPRSGSSWLMRMLAGAMDPPAIAIDEPRLGAHLALIEDRPGSDPPVARLNGELASLPSYLFSRRYQRTWRPALRRFVLERLRAEVEDSGRGTGPVIVKEPNGSQGADLIAALLPESRFVHLVRDPADVIDSLLDAADAGGWIGDAPNRAPMDREERLAFIERECGLWAHRLEAIERAMIESAATARRRELRYEELRAEPVAGITSTLSWMDAGSGPSGALTPADASRVAAAVERESFERVPESERGPGRQIRAATPGLWRKNLTAPEQELIGRLLGAQRERLGYP